MARLRTVSTANGVALVASYHDFECTPGLDTLLGRIPEAERRRADVAKVAVMPKDPDDVLTLPAATCRASRTVDLPLIIMSMGGLGALSRVVGWMYGSAATFAVGKSSSAPGQITVEELRGMLSAMRHAVTGGRARCRARALVGLIFGSPPPPPPRSNCVRSRRSATDGRPCCNAQAFGLAAIWRAC
jgi:3-dehydroquinate dehydratase I